MHQIHHRNRIMDNFLKLPFLIQCRRPLPASSVLSSANNVCFPIFSVLQRDDVVSRTWHLPLISCVWFVEESLVALLNPEFPANRLFGLGQSNISCLVVLKFILS